MLRTLDVVDRRVEWEGIAVAGERVFLVGESFEGEGVLIEARIPQP